MATVHDTARTPALPSSPDRSIDPGAGRWLWIVVAVAAAALIAQSILSPLQTAGSGPGLALGIVFLLWQTLATVFVFWHGARRYGWGILLFFVITQLISNGYENLSISTGFPFGHYHYTHDGAPFIFQVPATIGMAYFDYGYLAWCLASVLVGAGHGGRRSWSLTFVHPAVAAFIMVMWDLVMDPINSTIGRTWIWHDGGGYNGVPLTNYLGWFLTVWTVYQVFALVLRGRPGMIREQRSLGYWSMPVILYGLTAFSYVLAYALTRNGEVVDATGRTWSVSAIYETSVTVMLFTMMFATFLAAMTLVKDLQERRRERLSVL